MAVLTIPGWKSLGRRSRPAKDQDAPVRMGRRKGATMGTRRREEGRNGAWLPSMRHTLILAAKAAAVGLLLLLVLALLGWLAQRPMFQIKRAVVTGDLQQVDRELVAKRARTLRGNFFTVDLQAAAAELRTIPWVRSVRLRRLWPDGLEVQVDEQHPMAHWGDDALVNEQGEVFSADYSGTLPRFDGPSGSGPEMVQALAQFNRELAPLKRQVEAVDLSERGAWTLRLDNGLTIALGREKTHERLARFVGVYGVVFQNSSPQGATVDLRYPNGFALRAGDLRG
ncbi:MAG: cell division protein FtsQ/DivIB [Betaproteobacteria bacterium]|nr:cell division protein FtsQ/DivIB [Betaproteobacteria bacterium]MDE2621957.1 cell division protein FtsQ/DivIB [Betaproteobacteria bacterium]